MLSTAIPHPSTGASAVALFEYLTSFREAGFRIFHIVILKRSTLDQSALEHYISVFSSDAFRIHSVIVDGFTERGRTYTRPFRATRLPPVTVAWTKDMKPDLCFCYDIAAAGMRWTLDLPAKTLVWLGDLNFQVAWYKAWYAAQERWCDVFGLPLAWIEAQQWRTFYRTVLAPADKVIVTAKSSEGELARLGIPSTFLAYPWPESPLPSPPPPRQAKPSFVLFGHLAGLGSRSALHFLFEELYPKLLARWGREGFTITLCGTSALTPWAQTKLAQTPEVRSIGFANDLTSLLLSCHGVLVPIDIPVGNRTRIIVAMMLGTPVIAHRNTALGNPGLVDGETCYLAGDAETFAERMCRAYTHPEEVRRITRRARAVYDAAYRPAVACSAMARELRGLQASGRASWETRLCTPVPR